jgi:hypothetical protein
MENGQECWVGPAGHVCGQLQHAISGVNAAHDHWHQADGSPCIWSIETACIVCVAQMLQLACIEPLRELPSSLLQVTPLCHQIGVLWVQPDGCVVSRDGASSSKGFVDKVFLHYLDILINMLAMQTAKSLGSRLLACLLV